MNVNMKNSFADPMALVSCEAFRWLAMVTVEGLLSVVYLPKKSVLRSDVQEGVTPTFLN
jgi:hypothetical protein